METLCLFVQCIQFKKQMKGKGLHLLTLSFSFLVSRLTLSYSYLLLRLHQSNIGSAAHSSLPFRGLSIILGVAWHGMAYCHKISHLFSLLVPFPIALISKGKPSQGNILLGVCRSRCFSSLPLQSYPSNLSDPRLKVAKMMMAATQ